MPRRNIWDVLIRLAQLPWFMAGLILLLGVLISLKTGHLDRDRRLSDARSQVIQELATIRARLEGTINAVFSATSGLTGVIAYQGGISPDLFNALASQAITGYPSIRNIVAAPDNTITLLYPLEGNRQVLGLRYESIPEQFATVNQAMQTRLPVFSGPHDLVQGGKGLIARVPVFTRAGDPAGSEATLLGGGISGHLF